MKVKTNAQDENMIVFDNGLKVYSEHGQDCCEHNYLDFEQLPVGTELPTMDAIGFTKWISLKDDGFIVKDSYGIPKWVQARSSQNGYYSSGVNLVVQYEKDRIVPVREGQEEWGELFVGDQSEGY